MSCQVGAVEEVPGQVSLKRRWAPRLHYRHWSSLQARGVVGFFEAKPLSTREIYEWQVASANFTSQEFWVVYSTLQNDQLRSIPRWRVRVLTASGLKSLSVQEPRRCRTAFAPIASP